MKSSIALALLLGIFFWGRADAAIYRYRDDSGKVHYSNDLSTVPRDKLDQVSETKETPVEETRSVSAQPESPTFPLLQQDPSIEAMRIKKERLQKKQALEAEYQALVNEKAALDNNKSFQARRNKDKYRNRPYILEMIARETEIRNRLFELEKQLAEFSAE